MRLEPKITSFFDTRAGCRFSKMPAFMSTKHSVSEPRSIIKRTPFILLDGKRRFARDLKTRDWTSGGFLNTIMSKRLRFLSVSKRS